MRKFVFARCCTKEDPLDACYTISNDAVIRHWLGITLLLTLEGDNECASRSFANIWLVYALSQPETRIVFERFVAGGCSVHVLPGSTMGNKQSSRIRMSCVCPMTK